MKKIVLAVVVAELCSLNLGAADEDIAKFEAGCNAGIAKETAREPEHIIQIKAAEVRIPINKQEKYR